MNDIRIGIILGSTRPGRNGQAVAQWVHSRAADRDASYELIDLADFPLPHLDEAVPPAAGESANAHTHQWARKIAQFDGYIFVRPSTTTRSPAC